MCDPDRLKRVSLARQQEKGHSCLIYSVGSNGNYLFEEGIYTLLNGNFCEIHIFDPGDYGRDVSMYNMHYHRWGLKSNYDPSYLTPPDAEAYSFQEIVQKLGHENRTIDIFKVDCEGASCRGSWLVGALELTL